MSEFTGLKMFNPDNRIRFAWEMVVLAVIMWVIITIPVSVVFSGENTGESTALIELILTIVFTADILIRFNTSVIVKRQLVASRRRVFIIYLRSWLLIDLLSALPFWFILGGAEDAGITLQVLNFFRLARCLKLFRRYRR